jgi:hypothetical protein
MTTRSNPPRPALRPRNSEYTEDRCEVCIYSAYGREMLDTFDPMNDPIGALYCRRYPPTTSFAQPPKVGSDDWCGEFKRDRTL